MPNVKLIYFDNVPCDQFSIMAHMAACKGLISYLSDQRSVRERGSYIRILVELTVALDFCHIQMYTL